MDFAALKQELSDRGFADISDTRRGVYINQARAELDDLFCWPYRFTTTSGSAPLSISDLGEIEAVTDSTSAYALYPVDYRTLLDAYSDLTTTGSPAYYYVTYASGTASVNTYPVTTDTIDVRYWKVCPDLALSTDTPLAPSRFHGLYVDLAVRRAYRNTDNHEAARAIQEDINDQIQKMALSLGVGIPDGPKAYTGTSGYNF